MYNREEIAVFDFIKNPLKKGGEKRGWVIYFGDFGNSFFPYIPAFELDKKNLEKEKIMKKNTGLNHHTEEMSIKPFEGLNTMLNIVGQQLNPGTEMPEIAVESKEEVEVKNLPLTFSAIVSPEAELSSETETETPDEDFPLPSLEVTALDEAAIKEKIQTTKKWSEDAGTAIITCEEGLRRLDELESDPDSILSSATLRKQRVAFEQKIREIYSYPNKEAVGRTVYSAMLNRIRKANTPDEGLEAMEKAEGQGRFFRPTEELKREVKAKNNGKWPPGTIFFPYEGELIVFFSDRGENPDKPSDGQKALEAEARNMTQRVEINQATQMAKKGHRNLIRLKKGVLGFYYDHCRKGKDEKTGKMRLAGDLLVEVFDKNDYGEGKRTQSPYIVFKIVEATGSFSWLKRAMTKADLDYIPHYCLEGGVSKNLGEPKQKAAWNVVNCLKARIYAWENSQKPKSEEPTT